MTLRPIQSAALQSARELRGGFYPMRVGSGKTLTSLLIATVLGAKRPVLLIPAARKAPTYALIRELSEHWRITPPTIVSYSDLSQAKNATLLQNLPGLDCIIADEAHSLKDSQGSRWKRIMRCDPSIPFFAMSGSFANRDISEYRHLAVRALRDRAPVPLEWMEGQSWSRALNPRHPAPLDPGALLTLMPDGGNDAREVYGRRLVSAPGVISSGDDIPDIPLTFQAHDYPAGEEMRAAEAHMLSDWQTPCGFPIDTAMDMWRHLRELSHGLYYRWRDVPPPTWLQARKDLSAFIRAHTAGQRSVYDTPSQVFAALEAGVIKDDGSVARWREIEDTYVPVMKPVWCDESTLDAAADWLRRDLTQGICWVSVGEFGEALAKRTGTPFFRAGAEDETGLHIEQHRGVCIASVASCGTGHNLQHHQRNLVLSVPSPIALEQLIGRTHRDGQMHPVHVDFLLRLKSDHDQLAKAKMDAESVSKSFKVVQRLLYGQWVG